MHNDRALLWRSEVKAYSNLHSTHIVVHSNEACAQQRKHTLSHTLTHAHTSRGTCHASAATRAPVYVQLKHSPLRATTHATLVIGRRSRETAPVGPTAVGGSLCSPRRTAVPMQAVGGVAQAVRAWPAGQRRTLLTRRGPCRHRGGRQYGCLRRSVRVHHHVWRRAG